MSNFNISFVLEITKRDFTERFAGSLLGSLWAIIQPLVSLFIYLIIFGKLIGARLPGSSDINAYGMFLAAGLIPWTSFANTIVRSSTIFLDKKAIISKVNISLLSLLLYINLSEAITFIVSMLIFFIFILFKGYSFNSNYLLLPFIYYLQQLLAFGVGLLAAVLTVFIRDIREITGVVLQLWFWFTPIIYLIDILPDFAQKIMQYNPVYPIVTSYQQIFIFNEDPPFRALVVLTIATHFIIFWAYVMFRHLEKDVRDFI